MKRFKDRQKVISLTIVGIAYALIVLPLIVSNLQKQQALKSKADITQETIVPELDSAAINQNAQSLCLTSGNIEIGVSYTNTDTTKSVNVTASDAVSGKTIDLGTIEAGETKTGTINVDKSTINAGTITYTVAYTETPTQTQQKTANYSAKTCVPVTQASLSQIASDVPASCGIVSTDIVMVMDRSGSMGENNKLTQAKNAAKNFIDVVSKQEITTRIGLVAFSTTSTLSSPLTTDVTTLNAKIDALTAKGNTCHECGVKTANSEIATNGRAGVKKVVLLLTDGEANTVEGNTSQVGTTTASAKAMEAVKAGFNQSNTVFFTIGFDMDNTAAKQLLTDIAAVTGGKYYFPAPTELDGVYQEISQLIGKGILGGFVFNDLNLNGVYDTNEPKLSGWNIQATYAGGSKTTTTKTDGSYSFTGLCDGQYKLSPSMKSGWSQTLPVNTQPYTVDIKNASQYTNKNFGVTDKGRCSDGIDNDNNGFKDIDDSSCHSDGNPKNPNSYVPTKDGEHGGGNTCADSKDNNGNGLIDGADPACHTDGNPQNPGSYDPNKQESARCSDGIDNDNNGVKDADDPSCHTDGNPKNPGSYDPNKDGEKGGGNTCADGKDNNGDGTIDGGDPMCHTDGNPQNPGTYDPTRPESPRVSSLLLDVLLDGIGSRGDNTNPTNSSLSNKNPKHPTISADIQVYSLDNRIIASGAGTITYNATTGSYKGDVPVQSGFPTGKYIVKVKADTYLRRQVNGIQTITEGQKNQITTVALVAGDINNDNKLNILDYNLLLDCYSDLSKAPNCTVAEKQVRSDINDDGLVNQIDYNLFIREISTQPGQ